MIVVAAAQGLAGILPIAGAALGAAGVVLGALAVFLAGPSLLILGARTLPVLGLAAGAAGAIAELFGATARTGPTSRGGQGSLFASAGMVLLAFGAARVAERRRLEKRRRAGSAPAPRT